MIAGIGSTLARIDGTAGAARTTLNSTNTTSAAGGAAGADFGQVLASIATDATNTVRGAEAASIRGINGQASTQAVVEAVMAAERSLQTVVAVRDKAVAAYLDLSRMAI